MSSTSYDAPGRVTAQTLGNGLTTSYTYFPWTTVNGMGRLQRIQTGSLLDLSYTYDAVGNIKSITDGTNGGQVQNFAYDALDRLLTAQTNGVGSGQYNESYTYNPIGNLTSKSGVGTYTYPTAPGSPRPHAATAAGSNTYSYDANGNMTSRTENGATYTQGWDAENRLTVVTNTVTGQVTQFFYDGDGNRVKKVEGSVSTVYVGGHYEKNISAGVVTKYYSAAGQRVAMRKGGVVQYLHADHGDPADRLGKHHPGDGRRRHRHPGQPHVVQALRGDTRGGEHITNRPPLHRSD